MRTSMCPFHVVGYETHQPDFSSRLNCTEHSAITTTSADCVLFSTWRWSFPLRAAQPVQVEFAASAATSRAFWAAGDSERYCRASSVEPSWDGW